MDHVSKEVRSRMMARVKGRDTKPERIVRSELFRAGFRFRLHRRELPGCPDIVLRRYRTTILVHGCFWHGHDCRRGNLPTSNAAFWQKKIEQNIVRDRENEEKLRASGWLVITIWECALSEGMESALEQLAHIRTGNGSTPRPT